MNCQIIMNQNSPEPYVEFRFEDSLRKYEPGLRKRVKNSGDRCSQCERKNVYLNSKERPSIIRHCHHKHHAWSRDRFSSCSKLKNSLAAPSGRKEVSDFIDQPRPFQLDATNLWNKISLEGGQKLQFGQNLKDKEIVDEDEKDSDDKEEEMAEWWKREQMRKMQQLDLRIEFVEELHNDLMRNLEEMMEKGEKKMEEKVKDVSKREIEALPKPSQKKKKRRISEAIAEEEVQGGRIRLEGTKGQCYLSVRILAHLVKNKTITEAVTILEHWYPHLKLSPKDISTLVSLNILRTDTDI